MSIGLSCARPAKQRRLPMLDDNKKSERLTLWLTEREFIDLGRLAAKDDRKQSEMVRVLVRRAMYGVIGAIEQENNVANSGGEL